MCFDMTPPGPCELFIQRARQFRMICCEILQMRLRGLRGALRQGSTPSSSAPLKNESSISCPISSIRSHRRLPVTPLSRSACCAASRSGTGRAEMNKSAAKKSDLRLRVSSTVRTPARSKKRRSRADSGTIPPPRQSSFASRHALLRAGHRSARDLKRLQGVGQQPAFA